VPNKKYSAVSTSEHFSQICASCYGIRATSPCMVVGSMGGHLTGGVGQDTGSQRRSENPAILNAISSAIYNGSWQLTMDS